MLRYNSTVSDLSQQLPYACVILFFFLAYGLLVRNGKITGANILWSGLFVGVIAVGASTYHSVQMYETMKELQPNVPVAYVVFNPFAMALVSIYCVLLTYRTQRVQDLAVYPLGDTKVIVRQCPATRIPDADALLMPTNTSLRMNGHIPIRIALAAGPLVEKSAMARAPVGVGKVVETSGGRLAVGHIYHVAVSEAARPAARRAPAGRQDGRSRSPARTPPGKATASTVLQKGMDSAAVQARKGGAESIVVPLGVVSGLGMVDSMKAIVDGTLKQRRAFGEVVFVVFDLRDSKIAQEVVRRAVEALAPGAAEDVTVR
jgi:O-acetyl-ADP-ribose deacetylase (regulator of RNase III)